MLRILSARNVVQAGLIISIYRIQWIPGQSNFALRVKRRLIEKAPLHYQYLQQLQVNLAIQRDLGGYSGNDGSSDNRSVSNEK